MLHVLNYNALLYKKEMIKSTPMFVGSCLHSLHSNITPHVKYWFLHLSSSESSVIVSGSIIIKTILSLLFHESIIFSAMNRTLFPVHIRNSTVFFTKNSSLLHLKSLNLLSI